MAFVQSFPGISHNCISQIFWSLRCSNLNVLVAIIIILAGVAFDNAKAQSNTQLNDMGNFYHIQAEKNKYYLENPGAKGQKQWRRKEWFLEPRLYPTGELKNLSYQTVRAHARYVSAHPQQRSPHGSWLLLGPLNWNVGNAKNFGQGRINSIDFHPTDTNTIYIGTPNGGIWRTQTGGASWANISPDLPMLSIADIEVDYTNPNVIYALTGDGDPAVDELSAHIQTEVSSIGVIKTTDGGATWYPTNFIYEHPSSIVPSKLLMHPSDPDIQFVASKTGIYRTDDGWVTSNRVTSMPTFDIEFHPTNPMIMYASGKNQIRKSVEGGLLFSWSLVTDSDFGLLSATDRIELAVTPDADNYIYAIAANWKTARSVVYRSILEGVNSSWTVQDTISDLIGPIAEYYMVMAVNSSDKTQVIAGGVNLFKSESNGSAGSWSATTHGTVHLDMHDARYHAGALYVASDGGIYKSNDNGDSWTDLSPGLPISEIYRITGTPQNTNKYIIGAQDIGHHMRSSATTTFTNIGCCDGMVSLIDYTNQNNIYISGQYGGINKSIDGGMTFSSVGNPGDAGSWITPYIMDPVTPNTIFVGKDSVYRTVDGATTWQYMGRPSISNLNVMAQGINNPNRLYASSKNRIWRSDNVLDSIGPASWTEITSGLPPNFITGIAVNSNNANNVIVSMSGYSSGQKVYQNTSGTEGSWLNISGSLPNVPVNCIVYHDNGEDGLYIGTDIGVFYRDNSLSDWIYFSNFMPSVNVSDLYINLTNGTIAAGTYGRGLWLSNTYSNCNPNITLTASSTSGGVMYYAAGNAITSYNDYDPDLGTEIHYKAGSTIDLKEGFILGGLGFFDGKIGPCPTDITIPLSAPSAHSGKFIMGDLTAINPYKRN